MGRGVEIPAGLLRVSQAAKRGDETRFATQRLFVAGNGRARPPELQLDIAKVRVGRGGPGRSREDITIDFGGEFEVARVVGG